MGGWGGGWRADVCCNGLSTFQGLVYLSKQVFFFFFPSYLEKHRFLIILKEPEKSASTKY